MTQRKVVLVAGLRTPFRRSGTDYLGLTSYDLARLALRGILDKTGLQPEHIGLVVMGQRGAKRPRRATSPATPR